MGAVIKIDERQSKMQNFPLFMGSVLIAVIIPIVWAIFSVWKEDFGNDSSRKLQMLSLFFVWLAGALYGLACFFQIITTERREKFIVWRVVIKDGKSFELDGIFSKKNRFSSQDFEAFDKYQFKRNFREIGTLLSWRSGIYVLKLKDGKVFFFSKELMQEILPFFQKDGDYLACR